MTTGTGVRQIRPQELKALLDSQAPLQLLDVRTQAEWDIAHIEGARLLDRTVLEELADLDRSTLLVFQCHHGIRSQGAAQTFVARGFTNVANLVGGIEAWSLEVDPSVPRY